MAPEIQKKPGEHEEYGEPGEPGEAVTGGDPGAGLANLSREVPAPIHAQISDSFRSHIASGKWPAHYRLPSEPALATELGVSRGTLRRALSTLIAAGLLRQVRGRGTFVTPATIEPAIAQRLSTLSEDLAGQGVVTSVQVLCCELAVPPHHIAALLDISATAEVLRLDRVRTNAVGPVALLRNYVRSDLVTGIEAVDFSEEGLFAVLEGRYGLVIGSARRTFSAVTANDHVAKHLEIAPGDPVQYLEQITYLSDGRPVEYSDVWIPSTRLRISSLLTRRSA